MLLYLRCISKMIPLGSNSVMANSFTEGAGMRHDGEGRDTLILVRYWNFISSILLSAQGYPEHAYQAMEVRCIGVYIVQGFIDRNRFVASMFLCQFP